MTDPQACLAAGELVCSARIGELQVSVLADRQQLGAVAGAAAATHLRNLLDQQDHVRMMFAAAPSQTEFLAELVSHTDIDWTRVTAFHMDEYVGLDPDNPQRFGQWLDRHVFARVEFAAVHYVGLTAQDGAAAQVEAAAYAELLGAAPLDVVALGIGVNGHLAFNDPPVADFEDPYAVKVVELDPICRQQQVDDQCFATLSEVPTHAITVTIPALMAARTLLCMVPAPAKAVAVRDALAGPISPQCPASVLRLHPAAHLYLDRDSAAVAFDEGVLTRP